MEKLEQFIIAISKRGNVPQMYGWFHLLFLGMSIALIALLCVFARNKNEKFVKRFALVVWIVMIIVELYKQLIWSYSIGGSEDKWDYVWGVFPFQLCSTPLFVLPFFIFSKKDCVKDACAAYLATFSLFGGLVTIIYPPQVFIDIIGVNIQTMVHHCLQVVLGIYLACYYRKKLGFKFYLKGVVVYLILFATALSLNFIVPQFIDESFNMFYISMYEPCILPFLADFIYPHVPWIVFLLIYFIGFAGIALLIMGVEMLATKKSRKVLVGGENQTAQVEEQKEEVKTKNVKVEEVSSEVKAPAKKSTSTKSSSKTTAKNKTSKSGSKTGSKSTASSASKSTKKPAGSTAKASTKSASGAKTTKKTNSTAKSSAKKSTGTKKSTSAKSSTKKTQSKTSTKSTK